MRPSLLAVIILCAVSARAQFSDRKVDKFERGKSGGASVQSNAPASCGPAGCECPSGQYGMKKLRVTVYAPTQAEWFEDRITDAVATYGRRGALVRRTNSGTIALVPPHSRTHFNREPAEYPEPINDMEDLCYAVKGALDLEKPKFNDPAHDYSLPIFFLRFTSRDYFDNKRKQIEAKYPEGSADRKKALDELPPRGFKETFFTDANGAHFPSGIAAQCASDAIGVQGIPAVPMVIIDMEGTHKHVAAHEIGHAIGFLAGDPRKKALFDDISSPSIQNIMVTGRNVERDQMLLSDAQTQVLCQSPLLKDQP